MEFRDVTVAWRDPLNDYNAPFDVTVVVGDGTVEFGSEFDFDERVFYYFEDEQEFEEHLSDKFGNHFRILEVL